MDTFLKRIVWLIMIAPAIYLAIAWNKLPETVVMHFDLQGRPDRYGNRNELIIMAVVLIVVNALVYLLLTNIYRVDPKKYAAENKTRLNRMGFAISVFLSAIICIIIYSGVHADIKFNIRFILAAIGLLLAVIGNYMHTIRPNYFAGFRLPWTLENPENWRRTHLLGGKLFFIGGLFAAVVCLVLPPAASVIFFFTTIAIIMIITIAYSYRLYKKQKSLRSS